MRRTKNSQRTSPRISISMTPATYQALVAQAHDQGVPVSSLAARILGSGVDPGLEPAPVLTVDATGRLVVT